VSTLTFKSYESGVDSFSAEKLHVIWLDEECPKAIWIECLIRTITTGGVVFLTATPLLGMTELMVEAMDLYRVQEPLRSQSTDTYIAMATWDDAPHLTEQAKADLMSKIPATNGMRACAVFRKWEPGRSTRSQNQRCSCRRG